MLESIHKEIKQRREPGGVGSGFVFDKKGHIITNAHVIEDSTKTVVTFLDGRSYNAQIIGVDEYTDIGVIKVDADLKLLHPLSLGDSSNLQVGRTNNCNRQSIWIIRFYDIRNH